MQEFVLVLLKTDDRTSLCKHLREYITITRNTVALNPDAESWLDVAKIEEKLSAGKTEVEELRKAAEELRDRLAGSLDDPEQRTSFRDARHQKSDFY